MTFHIVKFKKKNEIKETKKRIEFVEEQNNDRGECDCRQTLVGETEESVKVKRESRNRG